MNRETGVRKKLNVRVIAACDSNLKRLSDKGLFSKSLYELVLDTTMRVPPLRERVKDIEVIASHILAEMSAQHNLPPKRLSPEALNLLTGCSWPGNIKQLQGVIEQAFSILPERSSNPTISNCLVTGRLKSPGNMIKTLLLLPGNLPVVISVNWQECLTSAVLPCTVI